MGNRNVATTTKKRLNIYHLPTDCHSSSVSKNFWDMAIMGLSDGIPPVYGTGPQNLMDPWIVSGDSHVDPWCYWFMGHVLIRKKMDVEYPEIQNKIYQDIKQKYWVVSYKSHINHATLQNTSKKWYKKYILLLKKNTKIY